VVAVDLAVVIPCYNAQEYIFETVTSALAQDLDPSAIEVIVVDDGSSDESADIVAELSKRDARLRLVRQGNAGVAVARNIGLANVSASARFVHFMDADDVLTPHALRRLRTRLVDEPDLVAAVGVCSRIDSDGHRTRDAELPFVAHVATEHEVTRVLAPDRIGYWHVLPITPISTPGQCLVRRSALPTDGPFDPSVVPCEDWDLWLRLTRIGDIGVEPVNVLRYRDHAASASKRYKLMQRQREAVFAKQVERVGADDRERLRRAWRFGMYRFDARLTRDWAKQGFADHDFVGGARYAVRSAKYSVRNLWAVVRRHPDL
jgi:glycosyltransferase involved in cell wall biosynthesis